MTKVRAFLSLGLLLLLSHPAWADNPWRDFDRDLAAIHSLTPRPEGSEGSRELVALIRDRLSRLRVPYRSLDFSDSEDVHSFSTSIVATIAGRKPDTVLLCVPIDSPSQPSAAGDGSIAPAVALEIARRAAASEPPLTLQILFLGAEEGEGNAYPMGTRRFLEDYYPEHPALVLYLRLAAVPQRIVLRAGSGRLVAPLWLVRRTLDSLEQAGLSARADGNEIQLLRAGLAGLRSPIGPYLSDGYPAVAIEGEYGPSRPDDLHGWVDAFSRFFDHFLAVNSAGIPRTWDRHYLLVNLGRRHFFVPEHLYILVLLVVFAVSVAYLQVARRQVTADIAAAGAHLGLLLLLLAATLAFLVAATGLIRLVQAARRTSDLWAASPGLFLSLKISTAALALLVTHRLLSARRGMRMARVPPRFYPAAALLLLVLGLIIVGIADVSLAVVFLWSIFFVLLYEASPWAWLRLTALVLAPLSVVVTGLALVIGPGSDAARILLLDPVRGNLVLAVLTLPYALLLLDLEAWLTIPAPAAAVLRRGAPIAAAAVTAGLLAAAMLVPAFGPDRPQVIEVTRYVDLVADSSRLELSSSAPLGTIRYERNGQTRTVTTRARTEVLPSTSPGDLLDISISSVPILDRENVTLQITPSGHPASVELTLLAAEKFLLFDSSFPATRAESGRTYTIHVGRYPPVPLSLELTLPKGGRFTLEVRARYEDVPLGVELPGAHRIVRSRMVVDRGFDFGT